MDFQSYNRTVLNERRIRRVDEKVITFSFSSLSQEETIKKNFRFPYDGTIKDIYASCGTTGGDETVITIEKCTQSDYDVIPVWEAILSDPVTIKSNRHSSSTADSTYSFKPGGEVVNANDHFRISPVKLGGASEIVVEIKIELVIDE